MGENCEITYAIDLRDMKRKTPDEVYLEYQEKHFPLVCELCKGRVFPRCGDIRSHHFAHMHVDNPTELQILCRESCEHSGGTGPSEWHKNWQRLFPTELREKCRVHGKDIRKADILFEKYSLVIEFQKGEFGGRFNKDTCIKRNIFWNTMGKKIIWLFEDTDLKNEKITKAQDKPCFRIFTPYLKTLFGDNIFDPSNIEVHIMYDGDAYYLHDFKACNNNITEAMFSRSFFNTYLENVKKHPADVIPDIEERIYEEMNEMLELAKKSDDRYSDTSQVNSPESLRKLLIDALNKGCGVVIAQNIVTNYQVKVSVIACNYTTILGYIKAPGYSVFLKKRVQILHADSEQWVLKRSYAERNAQPAV